MVEVAEIVEIVEQKKEANFIKAVAKVEQMIEKSLDKIK